MTYSTGSVILATDYNTFVGDVNKVWNDSGANDNYGYGQTAISTVAATNTVTATQWSTLLSRISSAASHQGTTITGITSPVAGNTISAYAALATNITAITNARYNCASVGATTTATGSAYTSAWTNSLTFTATFTFGSAAQARYFFNTGGRLTCAIARSGGTASPAGTALGSLLTACGTLNWTCGGVTQTIAGSSYTGTTKTGGSGSPTISTGTGYYQLTNVNQQVFQQTTTSYYGYEGDNLTINIRGSTAAPAPSIIITAAINRTGTVSGGTVDGTWTPTFTAVASETTNISDTWGTITASYTSAVA